MTITCDIQPTGVVTMAMKLLHNTCNMCIRDLPDMSALIRQASSIHIHIRQIPRGYVIYIQPLHTTLYFGSTYIQ